MYSKAKYVLLAIAASAQAKADLYTFTLAPASSYTDPANGVAEAAIPPGWIVSTMIDCGPGPTPAGPDWTLITQVTAPNTTTPPVEVPVGWYCAAHSSFGKGFPEGDFGNVIHLPAPAPTLTSAPKAPSVSAVHK